MTTPTAIRQWNIQGLPRDYFSTENAILATRVLASPLCKWSRQRLSDGDRIVLPSGIFNGAWVDPLFVVVDPQSQGTKWIKHMEKTNGLKIIDLQMRDYMKSIEECIKMGRPCLCQNVHEDLPQALNSVLVKSIKTSSENDARLKLQLGDREIDYNPSFRFYLSTRLTNPRYKPEIYSKVTVINFAIKEQGLEEQLLGRYRLRRDQSRENVLF